MCHYLLSLPSQKIPEVHPIIMQLISLKFSRDLSTKATSPCFFHQVSQTRQKFRFEQLKVKNICHYLLMATITMCHYLLSLPSQKTPEVHPIIMQLISLKFTRDLSTKATSPCFFHQVLQTRKQFIFEQSKQKIS